MMGPGGPGLTEQQLEQARKILKKYYPEMAERLDEVGRTARGRRRSGPPLGRHRFLRKMWPKIAELIEADRKDPNYASDLAKDHRLEQRIDRLSERYDKAKDQQRQELRDQVRELLVQQFEVRQRIRTWRLEDLECQIRKLKEELQSRAQQRQELIDRELERRLGQQEPLDW